MKRGLYRSVYFDSVEEYQKALGYAQREAIKVGLKPSRSFSWMVRRLFRLYEINGESLEIREESRRG